MNLTDFRTLGRSGLIVSPLALGTMTFGTPRWGSDDTVSKDVFNRYTEAGGNFTSSRRDKFPPRADRFCPVICIS